MSNRPILRDLAHIRRCLAHLKGSGRHIGVISVLQPAMYPAAMIMFSLAHKYLFNAVEYGQTGLYIRAVVLVVAAVLVTCGVQPIASFVWTADMIRGMDGLRGRVVCHALRLPRPYFDRHHSGDTISRLTHDLDAARQVREQLVSLLRPVYWGVGATAVMYALDWRLATLMVLLGAVETSVHLTFSQRVRRSSDRVQRLLARLNELLLDLIAGLRLVKVFGLQSVLLSDYGDTATGVARSHVRRAATGANMTMTSVVFTSVNFLGVLTLGIILLQAGEMDLGTVVAVVGLQEGVSYFFGEGARFLPKLQTSLAGVARALSVLDAEPESKSPLQLDARRSGAPEGAVTIRNLEFSYVTRVPVLKGVDMSVERGTTAALVGESGSGKSTILRLLMGFYTDYKGCITVEGIEPRQGPLDELRALISYVPQSPYLFHGTIRENIRCGKSEADNGSVLSAARAAQLDAVIDSLPLGWDTVVGELGGRLSGGERQRVGIARASLKDASLLLLDEATASMDSATEDKLHLAIADLAQGRTTIIVAHRLSTIRHADVVFVLSHGQVAARGTHAELLAGSPRYRKLVEAQFAE